MSPLSKAQFDATRPFPLSEEQWTAVSSGLDPAVIVAGAGSGKTTSMAARVAWLVGSGYARPDTVLGLTFTTKATSQLLTAMRGSLAALAAAGLTPSPFAADDSDVAADADDPEADLGGEPQVLTYHAFAARIVAEHGIRLGIEPGATLLADGARQQLAYRVVCRTDLPFAQVGGSPITLTKALLGLDDELTELSIDPVDLGAFDSGLSALLRGQDRLPVVFEGMLATSGQRALLAELVVQWRAEKAARGFVDFADQIRLAGEVVERYPDVVADLRARYRFVLLDEYQDTSIAQRRLLQRAFGGGHPVMAVGDPCQAIYGWRGASVDNIDHFLDHFPPAEAGRRGQRFTLSHNRRSGPAILEVANRASAPLRAVHAGVEPLLPGAEGKGPGHVSCALFETSAAELDWLVQQVDRTHGPDVAWKDIAVLCATGKDVVAVDAALRRRGIPAQVIGAAALLAQPAVIDLRAMLELVHDPTANPAFIRVATGPRWRIDPRDLAALGDRAAHLAGGRSRSGQADISAALDDAVAGSDIVESVSLTEALEDLGDLDQYSTEAVERFSAMAQELRTLRRNAGESLPEFVVRVMRTTGLQVEAALAPEGAASQQLHALDSFLDLAAEFTELDGRYTLGAFLTRLRDAERFEVNVDLEVAGPADAVQLLTVHKAKGLEFAYVFVPFVSEKAWPNGKARDQWPTSAGTVPWPLREDASDVLADFPPAEEPKDKDHKAYTAELRAVADLEDLRLAYVAFTRAERGLCVTGHWWGPSQIKPRGPARFLAAVHEACLDGAGEVVHWAEPPADDDVNPSPGARSESVPWPAEGASERRSAVLRAAEAVSAMAAHQPALPGLSVAAGGADAGRVDERALVERWDLLSAALVEEALARQAPERVVRLPDSVSASLLMAALADPEAVARDLARPMPRKPAPAARRGTAFHAWVESRYGQQSLLDPDDLPGAADADIVSAEALAELKAAFERSPYATRTPVAVEAPFAMVLGGRVVNGRIDAVFDSGVDAGATAPSTAGRPRYDVIDWKTGSAVGVDPVQLAVYRLAWASTSGVPLADVDAAFVMVATGEVIRPDTTAAVAALLALEAEQAS